MYSEGGAVGEDDFVAVNVVEGVAGDLVVDCEELVEDFLQAFNDTGFHVASGAGGRWGGVFGGCGCGCGCGYGCSGRLCGSGRDGRVGCYRGGGGTRVFWGTRVREEGEHARELAPLMGECSAASRLWF